MGKNLKNKELEKGLSQRGDGHYSARFINKKGKRVEKYFKTLKQARDWLKEARYKDNNELVPFEMVADKIIEDKIYALTYSDMIVDEWFDFWINNIVSDLRSNTLRNYKDRYRFNISPIIGKMKIRSVRPMHCKKVLMDMYDDYATLTIKQAYITMGTMFKAALINDVIIKHPLDGVRYVKNEKDKSDIKVLTVEEQNKFIEVSKFYRNHNQYMLIMETGLRTG